jgi:hypothetical protein
MPPRDRESKQGRFAVPPAAKVSPSEGRGALLVSITCRSRHFRSCVMRLFNTNTYTYIYACMLQLLQVRYIRLEQR